MIIILYSSFKVQFYQQRLKKIERLLSFRCTNFWWIRPLSIINLGDNPRCRKQLPLNWKRRDASTKLFYQIFLWKIFWYQKTKSNHVTIIDHRQNYKAHWARFTKKLQLPIKLGISVQKNFWLFYSNLAKTATNWLK